MKKLLVIFFIAVSIYGQTDSLKAHLQQVAYEEMRVNIRVMEVKSTIFDLQEELKELYKYKDIIDRRKKEVELLILQGKDKEK